MSKLYDLLSAMCGKIKKPDWNQNDPAAPDYVKNRPFYIGDPVETVLFDGAVENDTICPELIIGQEYTVTLDGTVYVLTAWDDGDGYVVLGSESLWWEKDYVDTEPPFAWGRDWFCAVNGNDSHTIKIVANLGEVHKIPSEYIDFQPSFRAEYHYDEETEETASYPVETLRVFSAGFRHPLFKTTRSNIIVTDFNSLMMPEEDFAFCSTPGSSYKLDVRDLAKGESVAFSVYKNKDEPTFNELAKSSNDFRSFIVVEVKDTNGAICAIANGYYGGTVITPNGKMCRITAARFMTNTDDEYVEIKATVIGILSVT